MKRTVCLMLALLFLLCGCGEAPVVPAAVNIKDAIAISQDGAVEQSVVEQIKSENAIVNFYGESSGFKYEWTVFGSDIKEAKAINLLVEISRAKNGDIKIAFPKAESFGYGILLSVHLNEKWDAQTAIAYYRGEAMGSVSLTGSKHTVINVTADGTKEEMIIRPDDSSIKEATAVKKEKAASAASDVKKDDYLSSDAKASDGVVRSYNVKNDGAENAAAAVRDDYLSSVGSSNSKVYAEGGKDKYHTDPIPEGKPKPVEPEDQQIDKSKSYTCTFSIECSAILNNLEKLDKEKLELVPSNGVILAKTKVKFYEGESVFDVLQRVCKKEKIHLESSWTPIYNSAYIEGINNLYEFDCGELSGWMYRVNGWYALYGCSRYQLKDGDVVEWRYTCDLGNDIGAEGIFG